MGKTEVENLDSSGIIANDLKEIESLETEINDAKSDPVMNKKNIISVSNEFIEKRTESLKVRDSFISISNDILTKKMNTKLILKILITLFTMIHQ